MKSYKGIILDLDRTLWDFEKNSRAELSRIFQRNDLGSFGLNENEFIEYYIHINELLWSQFRNGEIIHSEIRSRRFKEVLLNFGVESDVLAAQINQEYIDECPKNGDLFEGVEEWLRERREQGVKLYIASNGLQEIQEIKLSSTGILNLFEGVFCSNIIGATKPHKAFFDYILRRIDLPVSELCYLGDEVEVDGKAAEAVNMDFYLVENGKLNELCIKF